MASGNPIGYEVTDVTQETKYGLNGTPIPGKNVSFKTTSGYEGTLFIADTIFSDVTAMRQAIEGEARAVSAAMMIKGTVSG
ncbi:MAG: hypothetical protein ACRD45_22780 [Bryobacteraceae bacterium]